VYKSTGKFLYPINSKIETRTLALFHRLTCFIACLTHAVLSF